MKLFLFICLTFTTSSFFAQENASFWLDAYVKTIGGQNNIRRVQNIYSFANCVGPNGEYQTELYSAKNSKTIFRQIRKSKPDYVGVVNGNIAWTKGADVIISDKNSAYAWRSHEIQWMALHLEERFSEIKIIGEELFMDKQSTKFSAIDELGKTAQLYFDKTTNLLLGIVIFSPFGEKSETIRLDINEWKKIGKLLLPSKVSFTDNQGRFELSFHTIRINKADMSVFDIPEKIIAINKLLELHDLQRKAHFNHDAKLLISMMSDDFIEIKNGKINSPNKEQLVRRFQEYFNLVTFIEWDDIQTPIIQISEDLKTAYIHVSKSVKIKTNEGNEELTTYAWTSTFQKINDTWLMKSITSTVDEKK